MAKNDIIALRDQAAADLEKKQANLAKLQADARAIPEANDKRADLIRQIQDAKADIAAKANEHGELARAASLIAGGKNYAPPR